MPHPRKVVIYVDSNEQLLAERKFFLENKGFAVLGFRWALEAINALGSAHVMVTHYRDGDGWIGEAQRIQPDIVGLVIAASPVTVMHASICLVNPAPSELVEAVKTAAARKTGPRRAA